MHGSPRVTPRRPMGTGRHCAGQTRFEADGTKPKHCSSDLERKIPHRTRPDQTKPHQTISDQRVPARSQAMSERGSFRGGARGRGGGEHRGGRGSHPTQHRGGGAGGGAQQQEKPKKENILDLTKYMDKQVNVKFNGGREVTGTLKGYDQLMNLVLDDVKEVMRDDEGNETTRSLGLVVARGTLLVLISPADGSEEIPNPFVQPEE
ncbi:hypothetical protein DTO166G4_5558 [Paecilomyces variotii]|nr:hypothetical protein DTO166G4_5558 [Paecilomyces variotii]KAJ9232110.1 hypothetical protein DTO166G5_6438 [Paecilomyces variotii]KAJ9250327.1 hypothetical protein DTO207G8_6096 [Paecilomyces variotii]KAJ9304053.1 hypothetical protein DTO217A2_6401 [Paecilomyces variotii]KAJ9408961.1 hypothetical protein DTO045G8_3136 [Paecilomyces variotii]